MFPLVSPSLQVVTIPENWFKAFMTIPSNLAGNISFSGWVHFCDEAERKKAKDKNSRREMNDQERLKRVLQHWQKGKLAAWWNTFVDKTLWAKRRRAIASRVLYRWRSQNLQVLFGQWRGNVKARKAKKDTSGGRWKEREERERKEAKGKVVEDERRGEAAARRRMEQEEVTQRSALARERSDEAADMAAMADADRESGPWRSVHNDRDTRHASALEIAANRIGQHAWTSGGGGGGGVLNIIVRMGPGGHIDTGVPGVYGDDVEKASITHCTQIPVTMSNGSRKWESCMPRFDAKYGVVGGGKEGRSTATTASAASAATAVTEGELARSYFRIARVMGAPVEGGAAMQGAAQSDRFGGSCCSRLGRYDGMAACRPAALLPVVFYEFMRDLGDGAGEGDGGGAAAGPLLLYQLVPEETVWVAIEDVVEPAFFILEEVRKRRGSDAAAAGNGSEFVPCTIKDAGVVFQEQRRYIVQKRLLREAQGWCNVHPI